MYTTPHGRSFTGDVQVYYLLAGGSGNLPADCSCNVAVQRHNPHNEHQLVLSLKTRLSVESIFYPEQKVKTYCT